MLALRLGFYGDIPTDVLSTRGPNLKLLYLSTTKKEKKTDWLVQKVAPVCPEPIKHFDVQKFTTVNLNLKKQLYSWVANNPTWIFANFPMSHSIHILSIQIETKNLDFIRSTTSNCPSLQAIWNGVLHYVSLVVAVGLLDTLLPLKRWSKLAL